jgi:hypothetical protein
VKAHLDHVDSTFQTEDAARKRQRRTPLARTGLRREPFRAGNLIVVSLRDGGVGLMAARRAHSFVLVIDMRRSLERLFEANGAQQRCGAVERIDRAHLLRDLDHSLPAHFLGDEALREKRRHQVRRDRLSRSGMQRRRQRLRKIRQQVIPVCRKFLRGKQELNVVAHG